MQTCLDHRDAVCVHPPPPQFLSFFHCHSHDGLFAYMTTEIIHLHSGVCVSRRVGKREKERENMWGRNGVVIQAFRQEKKLHKREGEKERERESEKERARKRERVCRWVVGECKTQCKHMHFAFTWNLAPRKTRRQMYPPPPHCFHIINRQSPGLRWCRRGYIKKWKEGWPFGENGEQQYSPAHYNLSSWLFKINLTFSINTHRSTKTLNCCSPW